MKPRVLVLGLAMWLGVVALGSGATWLVIERVGRDVVSTQSDVSDASASGSTPTRTTPTPSASSSPSRKPRPTSTPPSTAAPPAPASSAPGAPTAPATTRPPPISSSKAPATRSPDPQAPSAVTRTWSGSAGRVTVRCTGARIALVSASPADGWRVEAGERGPEQVEVEFKRSAEGGEIHVKARCAGGQPRFEVESDDDD